MSRDYVTEVKKWVPKKELVEKIKEKRIEVRVYERLLFIKYLYEEDTVPKACEKVEISEPTGYEWRKRWNKNGIEGIIPNFGGGKPSKLSKKQEKQLKEKLKERDDWTLQEIKNLIEKEFNVTYTERHLRRKLKNMGMNHGKPFQHDYRQPENAENQLKKTDKNT